MSTLTMTLTQTSKSRLSATLIGIAMAMLSTTLVTRTAQVTRTHRVPAAPMAAVELPAAKAPNHFALRAPVGEPTAVTRAPLVRALRSASFQRASRTLLAGGMTSYIR